MKSLVTSVNGDCSFIIAESEDEKTLYIAFNGTECLQDLVTYFNDPSKQSPDATSVEKTRGSIFLSRANAFPFSTVNKFMEGKNIVLCGHSLGGTLSALVYWQFKSNQSRHIELTPYDDVINITFGSPLFDVFSFNCFVENSSNPDPRMYNIVSESDPVPNLVCLAQIVAEQKIKLSMSSTLLSIRNNANFWRCKKLLEKVLRIISVVADPRAVMSKKISDSLSSLKDENLEEEEKELRRRFFHIGNYIVLPEENSEKFYTWKSDKIMHCFEHLKTINWEKVYSHKLENYEIKKEIKSCFEKRTDARDKIETIEFFEPRVIDGELVCEEDQEDKLVILNLKGENIACICLERCEFNFGFRFGVNRKSEIKHVLVGSSPNKEELIISQAVAQEDLINSGIFHLKLATVFGECEYTLRRNEIRNIEVPTVMKFSKDAPACQILKKAFHRGVALLEISDGNNLHGPLIEGILDLAKLTLEESEFDQLSRIFDLGKDALQNLVNNEAEYQKVQQLFEKITNILQSGLRLEASKSALEKLGIAVCAVGAAGVGAFLAGPGWLLFGTMQSLGIGGAVGLCGGGFGGNWLFYRDLGQRNYYFFLQIVGKQLFKAYKKRLPLEETHQDLEDLIRRDGVYHLEKALSLMYDPQLGKNNFNGCELEGVYETCKEELTKRIEAIKQMHELREQLAKQCFIGVIGPQDAGKSTFLNQMWNCHAQTGINRHTTKPTLYDINDKIKVIDFPGQNSFEDYSRSFSICGSMNNIIIVILYFTGDVSKTVSSQLKKVFHAVADSPDHRIIICINQCGNKLKDLEDYELELEQTEAAIKSPLKQLKANYINKINSYFRETDNSLRVSLNEKTYFLQTGS